MRTRGPKKTSTVIITLTITVIIVTALIIGIMMLITKKEPVNIADNNQGSVTQEVATGKFYENGWDSSVVAEIRDGVPVPTGYTYVSGEKETGLIIQNEENGKQYVWIPYDEEVANTQEETAEETEILEVNNFPITNYIWFDYDNFVENKSRILPKSDFAPSDIKISSVSSSTL